MFERMIKKKNYAIKTVQNYMDNCLNFYLYVFYTFRNGILNDIFSNINIFVCFRLNQQCIGKKDMQQLRESLKFNQTGTEAYHFYDNYLN